MRDALAILDVIGIRAIFVDQLGEEAVLSLQAGVLLLDHGLPAEDAADVADQVLSLAAAALSVP